MSAIPSSLELEYAEALGSYLRAPSEAALSRAYGIGRRALDAGIGLLDVASVHTRAASALAREAAPGAPPRGDAAGAFLRELLSPFEMSLRGYREANARLETMNATLVQQKDALETVNRELEAFSYSVSHDLRAPLRSIDGFSQALLEDHGDVLDEEGKRYLRYVRESAQEMAQLIDGLLGLSRVTRAGIRRTDVDLSPLARRVVERLRAAEPGRRVDVAIADRLPAAGDPALLEIVLQNLIGNAWKFTSKRSEARIDVGAADEGGHLVYFVRDDGAGFDMAHAQKLFGVFQRLHPAREFEGTGIGLATVQRIVRRHGGKVWAEGRVGRGATFYFTLRAAEGAP